MDMENREINKEDVIQFFNDKADKWDENLKKSDEVINTILDHCCIGKNSIVLDVATGTGVLFDYYKQREAKAIGIDISEKMIEIAKRKYPDFSFLVEDGETFQSEKRYDAIVIYNAFPHFSHPAKLIENLSSLLKQDGRLTIAHGMSREKINGIHHAGAAHVSNGLMEIDDLKKLVEQHLAVEVKISNESMYQIVGRKACK